MKKKLENFIFYYKYHMVALIFVIILAVVLFRDKSGDELDFVIVDDTSCMNLTVAESMMKDFETTQKIKSGSTAFRYKSMYLSQEKYKDISFDIAKISDYEECFTNGSIDMVITTVDRIENTAKQNNAKELKTETLGGTDTKEKKQSESATEETKATISYEAAPLEQVLSKEEMSQYEKYLYYMDNKAVGIIFNKCKKAEEYFGDNYPTGYHYILQVAVGSANDQQVKKFLRYLIGE